MKPAFTLRLIFPPPASRSLVFPRTQRSRAWFAANRNETLIMKRVVGYSAVANQIPQLGLRDGGERVRLQHALRLVCPVPLQNGNVCASGTLVAALARDPPIEALQHSPQGRDLANSAALAVPVLVEAE